jgi:hypothetical protein
MSIILKNYKPHLGQQAFHYAISSLYRFVLLFCGIRGGKTHAGAREAGKQAWNSPFDPPAAYCIVAPTYNMLDRTTWMEFSQAMHPFIISNNSSKKIIVLRNGRLVYGFSAEEPDKIRNVTASGFWIDEARECKDFANLWRVMLGRVLSTGGKGIVTTSPNSFDDIYDIFIKKRKPQYGLVKFSTSRNTYLSQTAVDELYSLYDEKFARQELGGELVIFEGAVYYTFNRNENAGDLAFKIAQYDPRKPICLCADFNVDPMVWVLAQIGINAQTGLKEIYVFDEIFLRNSNTVECCQEFKLRYPNHNSRIDLYGDATGEARHTDSNVTNYRIIENELGRYGISRHIPLKNPAERDRVNSVNGMICNSKNERRVFVNPTKCTHLISDFEQVPYKEGSVQIDKKKNLLLTHASDAFGYMAEKEFSIAKGKAELLKI